MRDSIFSSHYNKPTSTLVPLQNISIGDFCVARFSEDRMWYRARVVLNNSMFIFCSFLLQDNSTENI